PRTPCHPVPSAPSRTALDRERSTSFLSSQTSPQFPGPHAISIHFTAMSHGREGSSSGAHIRDNCFTDGGAPGADTPRGTEGARRPLRRIPRLGARANAVWAGPAPAAARRLLHVLQA